MFGPLIVRGKVATGWVYHTWSLYRYGKEKIDQTQLQWYLWQFLRAPAGPGQFLGLTAINGAYSYIFHTCNLLTHSPLLHFPPQQLCLCHIFIRPVGCFGEFGENWLSINVKLLPVRRSLIRNSITSETKVSASYSSGGDGVQGRELCPFPR